MLIPVQHLGCFTQPNFYCRDRALAYDSDLPDRKLCCNGQYDHFPLVGVQPHESLVYCCSRRAIAFRCWRFDGILLNRDIGSCIA